jgi:hypothetical protein
MEPIWNFFGESSEFSKELYPVSLVFSFMTGRLANGV